MYEIIIFTHSSLSESLVETTEMIMGKVNFISSFSVQEDSNLKSLEETLENKIKKIMNNNFKVLVLTDIYFGTPFNIIVNLMNKYEIEHITGINLPTLIEIISLNNQDKLEVDINNLIIEGRKSIQIVGL